MKFTVAKGLAISLLALSLASCATDAPPPPPPPPPPAPAGPPVALASGVSDAAATYVDYIQQARSVSAIFPDGNDVQAKLKLASAYEPQQLARGAVAYGAIAAMQEPSFRAALRAYAADATARAEMTSKLLSDPSYAAGLPAADVAARRVILALSSDGQSVYKAGSGVKQAAYDIQRQKWSKEFVTGRDERLAQAKQNSVTLKSVRSDESSRLLAAALSGTGLTTRATTGAATGDATLNASPAPADSAGNPAATQVSQSMMPATPSMEPAVDFGRPDLFNTPYTNAVNRSLTIAALAILGEGGEARSDAVTALLDDDSGEKCFDMSKLNLYQCLAVAKPYYEDIFCLGQHILMDTGQCLGKMSSNALSFAPVKRIGFNDDGTVSASHANAVSYADMNKKPVKKSTKKKAPAKKAAATKKKAT